MKQLIELSHTELLLSFAASCVEGAARRLGVGYREVFDRMARVNLIEGYILPYYDVLHLESREHLIDNVIECLERWEQRK
jgi:hypothetical protein